ncbi:unnamed protein product, partial [marine sediment metagenome]
LWMSKFFTGMSMSELGYDSLIHFKRKAWSIFKILNMNQG